MNRIRNKKAINPKTLIFLTLITMIIVTAFSMSKYYSTIAGKDTARVAKMVIDLQNVSTISVPINPSTDNKLQEFYFEISNKNDDENKAESSFLYDIELENVANLPLEFSLYKYNENTKNYDQIELNVNTTKKIEMNVNETNNHKYKLEIKWKDNTSDSNYDSYKFSKTIDYIKLIINATQKD